MARYTFVACRCLAASNAASRSANLPRGGPLRQQFIAAVATLPVGVQRAGRLEQQEQRVISTLRIYLSGRS